MKKKIIGFIMTISVFLMGLGCSVFADAASDIEQIATKVKTVGVAIIVFSAVVTAVLYMASSVNPGLKGKAKEALIALIIGCVILALSSQISSYISDLLPDTAERLK